ncbi:MAG: DUF4911 domain-containing protein [Candidatus Mcinerneyibacterium aminivorans]|uniref:DUF4911 domain-containing protein n=1 Tax=Candidatus Mcinerneyibacterium aminivorans TaxID=2703815 RepID=A0A5D0MB37_9BACT|nr:MAG: DUF4911 domain-containing protein [Candidatus Mcinerneyibacterium aminivorans]
MKEKKILIKINPENVAFLKAVFQASDNLAFMRVEDKKVKIFTTDGRYKETMDILKSLKEKLNIKFIET